MHYKLSPFVQSTEILLTAKLQLPSRYVQYQQHTVPRLSCWDILQCNWGYKQFNLCAVCSWVIFQFISICQLYPLCCWLLFYHSWGHHELCLFHVPDWLVLPNNRIFLLHAVPCRELLCHQCKLFVHTLSSWQVFGNCQRHQQRCMPGVPCRELRTLRVLLVHTVSAGDILFGFRLCIMLALPQWHVDTTPRDNTASAVHASGEQQDFCLNTPSLVGL